MKHRQLNLSSLTEKNQDDETETTPKEDLEKSEIIHKEKKENIT